MVRRKERALAFTAGAACAFFLGCIGAGAIPALDPAAHPRQPLTRTSSLASFAQPKSTPPQQKGNNIFLNILPFHPKKSTQDQATAEENLRKRFAKHLTHPEARKFWCDNFKTESVPWNEFSAALSHEFVLALADLIYIKRQLDTDEDGVISLTEFQIFSEKLGLALSLQQIMNAPTPPPRRIGGEAPVETTAWLPVLPYAPPTAKISTWQPAREQQAAIKANLAEWKTFIFASAVFMYLRYVLTFDHAETWFEFLETYKFGGELVSLLEFGSATVVCFNYRCEAERLTNAGDARLLMMYRTLVGFYVHTLVKCTFLQFGGTTTTGLILGQSASWISTSASWSGFLLAYWLVFCSPFDVWFKLLKDGYVLFPLKVIELMRLVSAVTTKGMDAALVAEHSRMRSSVWGCLLCGFTSGTFGAMLAGIAEEGEAWMTTKCPTWTQQRVFYSIFTYYFLTDPHRNLNLYAKEVCRMLRLRSPTMEPCPEDGFWPLLKPVRCKMMIIFFLSVLQWGLDIEGTDLLIPVNKAFTILFSSIFSVQMDRMVDKGKQIGTGSYVAA